MNPEFISKYPFEMEDENRETLEMKVRNKACLSLGIAN
jgi:hypothetical protein